MAIQTALDPVADLIDEAKRVLPGGTFGNMPGEVMLRAGKGGRIWDMDGNAFIDLRMGYGPVILGHGDERVDEVARMLSGGVAKDSAARHARELIDASRAGRR